jgi:3-deoxy-alpha-D-manno-octulosonate 8-oxidase
MGFRQFKAVPTVTFSRGALAHLPDAIGKLRKVTGKAAVFIFDHFFADGRLADRAGVGKGDLCLYLDTSHEPRTSTVDDFAVRVKNELAAPCAVIGVGGGAALDVAKATSVLLTNPGKAEDYQGWDLVQNKAVHKIGVPTISGSGAEVSRTAVLIGPRKKQGINSDFSTFDEIVLDPDLLVTVPAHKRFYTGMDCYIHSVEAISGTFLNEFSRAFSEQALYLSRRVFLNEENDAELMVASYLGGCAIAYSEVGVCHALSYGLSYAFGVPHGLSNCLVFRHLDEFYPTYVQEFQRLVEKSGVTIDASLLHPVDDVMMEKMIDIALLMEKPLCNALGPAWSSIMTREKIRDYYSRIIG